MRNFFGFVLFVLTVAIVMFGVNERFRSWVKGVVSRFRNG